MNPLRVSILGVLIGLLLLVVVVELIRRNRLQERYALLWIITAVVLVVLSLWRSAVEALARLIGVAYAPALLLAVTSFFIMVVLLHYSTVISKLARRNVDLAQAVALMEERVRRLESEASRRATGHRCSDSGDEGDSGS